MAKAKPLHRFGQNLNDLMRTLGMSKAELARRSGLTPAAVTQIAQGTREPSLTSVIRILRVIPVKFEQLVRTEEDPKDG